MVIEFPGCGCVTNMRVVTVVLLLGVMFSQDAGSSWTDPLGPGPYRRADPLGPGLSRRAELQGPGLSRRTELQGPGLSSRTPETGPVVSGLRRRSAEELLLLDDSSNPCFSLRENEEQRQLLCHDRRSKFNFNPFGLRFGKRYNGYVYRRAVQRARTRSFSSPSSGSVLRPPHVEEAF